MFLCGQLSIVQLNASVTNFSTFTLYKESGITPSSISSIVKTHFKKNYIKSNSASILPSIRQCEVDCDIN